MTKIRLLGIGVYSLNEEISRNMAWLMKDNMDIILSRSGHGNILRYLALRKCDVRGGGWIVDEKLCFTSGYVHGVPKCLENYVFDTLQEVFPKLRIVQ